MPAYRDKKGTSWFVKFRYKDWQNQTKWVTKRGFSTKRDALQWEREFLQKQAGDVTMSFAAFVDIYRKERFPRLKQSTRGMKDNIIDIKILPYFGKKKLNEISSSDVIQWQNILLEYEDPKSGEKYSLSYLKTVHNQLSAIFNYAMRHYKLKENPAREAGNMGSEKDINMNFWTEEQYASFAEEAMDNLVAYYCFEVLYWCGIREGELLALTTQDFNFDTKQISITKTYQRLEQEDVITPPKTPKSKRNVVMPDFLCDEMRYYFKTCYDLKPTDRVFPVNKAFLGRALKKYAEKAGVPAIRVHDLRHSHVSLLINRGYGAVAIAERMGHESIDITYRYAHLFPNVQEKMAEDLNALRGDRYVC